MSVFFGEGHIAKRNLNSGNDMKHGASAAGGSNSHVHGVSSTHQKTSLSPTFTHRLLEYYYSRRPPAAMSEAQLSLALPACRQRSGIDFFLASRHRVHGNLKLGEAEYRG